MQQKSPLRLAGSLAVGLVYFAALMGISTAFVALNANLTPALPWFPVPALALIAVVTVLLGRRWPLRLVCPAAAIATRVYGLALLATLAAMCLSVLEAAWHGLVRTGPSWDGDVSTVFQLTFLLVIPFIASILAEIGFRGVIQTQLERWLPLWPMLLLLAVLNAAFHFYDPEQNSQWLRFISLNLGFGYVTWLSQSIRPALVAHIAMNIVEPVSEKIFGPIALGELGTTTLTATAIVGLAALGGCIYLSLSIRKEQRNA